MKKSASDNFQSMPITAQLRAKLEGPSDSSQLATLLPYAALVILLPVAAFFFCQLYLFEGVLGLSPTSSNVCAAVVAVLLLHVVLATIILKAMQPDTKQAKQD